MHMGTTEIFLIAMLIIFSVPYLIWRFGKTDYYAPLVVVQIIAGILLGPGIMGRAFPVCLLVNAAFTRFVDPEPELQMLGMLLAWSASLLAGAAFHRWVELPLSRAVQFVSDKIDTRDWLKPDSGRAGVVTLR